MFIKKLLILSLLGFPVVLSAENVGTGTNNPVARLQVVDSAVVFSAAGVVPPVSGKTAIEGAGRRMMWHPVKAAFRVGYVTANAWDNLNIGDFSFAAGKDVLASAPGSIALGSDNQANGFGGMAIGSNCLATYNNGIAIGTIAKSQSGYGYAKLATGFYGCTIPGHSLSLCFLFTAALLSFITATLKQTGVYKFYAVLWIFNGAVVCWSVTQVPANKSRIFNILCWYLAT